MSYFQPHLEGLVGYTPGEQPQELDSVLKLNTNESSYPPSPRAIEAIRRAAENLRRYPDPLGRAFRRAAARVYGVPEDWIVPTNGSDEALTMLVRACAGLGDTIVAPTPSYLLYRVLANIQGCRFEERLFTPDGQLPTGFCDGAKLAIVPNPNSPTGSAIVPETLLEIAEASKALLVVDEAYAEFADDHAIRLVERCERLVVTRTLSKAYGLAGLRFGYVVAQPPIAAMLREVKDSYNCDALSLAGATAAMEDRAYLSEVVGNVRRTRARLSAGLSALGFSVAPSQANFVWATNRRQLEPIYLRLKERGILIRYFNYPSVGEGIRITVGTDAEIDRLLAVLPSCL
jgi:histidinol-phosphate aminotransferase